MTSTHFEDVKEFHDKFSIKNATILNLPDSFNIFTKTIISHHIEQINSLSTFVSSLQTLRGLRISLLLEEVSEYLEAEINDDLVGIADGLGDIGVIADGTALTYGIPLDDIRKEIHRSNMSKLGADGKPIYREDGKVLKGPNYSNPDIQSILINKLKGG